jgi:hypothetical protein
MHSCCKKQRSHTIEFFEGPYEGPELEAMVGFKPYNTDADAKLGIMQRMEHGVPASPDATHVAATDSELFALLSFFV